jgi:hypothetical protein
LGRTSMLYREGFPTDMSASSTSSAHNRLEPIHDVESGFATLDQSSHQWAPLEMRDVHELHQAERDLQAPFDFGHSEMHRSRCGLDTVH